MEFQKTNEFKLLFLELNTINILDEVAIFKCYSDNIFTYHLIVNETLHEFNIISESDYFMSMPISDLINEKSISFFEHAIYLDNKKIGGLNWSKFENSELN
jgi:hypothetical protein